jgi:ferredoxin-NADP reductase
MSVTSPVTSQRKNWRVAEVVDIGEETSRVRTLTLRVADWPGHVPGQHVDVRLTGEDGSQAQRSYSITSAPEAREISLAVERLEEGEVSPYLASEVRPGDRFELRGPIGGYFIWTVERGGPLVLIAGGSGIAPLMSMLRHRATQKAKFPATLLYSARRYEEIIFREELDRMAAADPYLQVAYTLTREQPADWRGGNKRIDRESLLAFVNTPKQRPQIYVCGPSGLVENTAKLLIEIGHERGCIRTERFGPTGA